MGPGHDSLDGPGTSNDPIKRIKACNHQKNQGLKPSKESRIESS